MVQDFSVNETDTISVQYYGDSDINRSNFYKIFAQSGATGQTIYLSPITSTFTDITYSCGSTTSCDFSVGIANAVADAVTVSVYINGIANVYDFSTSTVRKIVTKNFSFLPGDVLQVFSVLDYAVDSSARYIIYNQPDGGIPFYSSIANFNNSPDVSVPNFCGQTLELELDIDSLTPVDGKLYVSVVPSFAASTPFQVLLNMVCTDNSKDQNQQRLTSATSADTIIFDVTGIDLSGCYLIASSNDPINYPYADSFKVYLSPSDVEVSFVSPSQGEVFVKGSSVPVLLSTSDTSVTTATVAMSCSDDIQSQSVTTGTSSIFIIPMGSFASCSLAISDLEPGYKATGSPITIIASEPPLPPSPFGPLTPITKEQQAEVAKSLCILGTFTIN